MPLQLLGTDPKAPLSPVVSLDDVTVFEPNYDGCRGNHDGCHGDKDGCHGDDDQPNHGDIASQPEGAQQYVCFVLPVTSPMDTAEITQCSDASSDSGTDSPSVPVAKKSSPLKDCRECHITKSDSIRQTQKLPRPHCGQKKKMRRRLLGDISFSDGENSTTALGNGDKSDKNGKEGFTTICSRNVEVDHLRKKVLHVESTPVTGQTVAVRVLEYDTPEADYGVSVRQRRLKAARQRNLYPPS